MSKIMGSWSTVRKYLEQNMLCSSLRGRVRYNCTKYPNTDHDGVFEVFIDGRSVKNFSSESIGKEARKLYGVVGGRSEFWDNMLYHKYYGSQNRTEFDDREFSSSLKDYRQSDIITSINSLNPIVRMFAILDRRLGKRQLQRLKSVIYLQPDWLQFFYNLRMVSDKIL